MAGQVVQDDHIAFAQGRRELGLDVGIERRAVHGTVDDPGRVQPVVAQRRDKRLRAPVAEGRVIDQPLPARRPAGGLGHVGFQPGFVNEANAFQHMRHEGLAVHDPDMPLAGHLGALLLKRLNVVRRGIDPPDQFLILLTLCVSPSRWNSRQTELGFTDTPRSASKRAAISSSVISPLASTCARTQSS